MSSGSAASSAAPGNPELLFEHVLDELELSNIKCTVKGQGQGGGIDGEIKLEEITILIILFHGSTELTEEVVKERREKDLDTIHVDSLSNVNNLAYLALAPTGQVNLGTFTELNFWRDFLKNEMMTHIIHAITGKLNKLITATSISEPETKPESRLSGICKYCFTLLPDKILSFLQTSLETFLPYLNGLFPNFDFTGEFRVCRTVEPPVAPDQRSHPYSITSKKTQKKSSVSMTSRGVSMTSRGVSMNFEMFLLLLESLRISIKKCDTGRFPGVCRLIPKPWCDSRNCAYDSRGQRCRNLSILKGFGETHRIPFINKKLAHSPSDEIYGMGVMKLNFTTDSSGIVRHSEQFFTPDMVTHGVRVKVKGNSTTSWFNMQECINFCTSRENAKNSKTVFVLDMSCSSNGTGIFNTVTPTRKDGGVTGPGGGGKRIKKKSASMKKTRRIKNKSKSTRYIRNRRNRLKHNKRTKKGRKTKTYRKH